MHCTTGAKWREREPNQSHLHTPGSSSFPSPTSHVALTNNFNMLFLFVVYFTSLRLQIIVQSSLTFRGFANLRVRLKNKNKKKPVTFPVRIQASCRSGAADHAISA